MNVREVRIHRVGEGFKAFWSVSYVQRKKGQRYSAASFDANHYPVEVAIDWAKTNPKLRLVGVVTK